MHTIVLFITHEHKHAFMKGTIIYVYKQYPGAFTNKLYRSVYVNRNM